MSTAGPPSSSKVRAFDAFDLRQARARLLLAVVVGVAMTLGLTLLPSGPGWAVRIVAGWDAAGVVILALAWSIIWRSDTKETRHRAAMEDPGRNAVWGIVLTTSAFSLFAAVVVLRRAKILSPGESALLVGLCLAAVVTAWLLTHTAYTLRYAHLYYREDEHEGEGGLDFPEQQCPDYFDFAYFAFTIGMCFQVSDVVISSRRIRRAVLGHALLSFAYNTAILALALNLLFGLLG